MNPNVKIENEKPTTISMKKISDRKHLTLRIRFREQAGKKINKILMIQETKKTVRTVAVPAAAVLVAMKTKNQ